MVTHPCKLTCKKESENRKCEQPDQCTILQTMELKRSERCHLGMQEQYTPNEEVSMQEETVRRLLLQKMLERIKIQFVLLNENGICYKAQPKKRKKIVL